MINNRIIKKTLEEVKNLNKSGGEENKIWEKIEKI